MADPRTDPAPSLIRGRRYYVAVGRDAVDGADAAMILTARDVTEAVRHFTEHTMVGDVIEITPGEYPTWHNYVQSLSPGQLRLPRPSSGTHLGVLEEATR